MAGRDKTTAWENVKWIKTHLPAWEKKGMTRGFINSIISPKYKGCELDVGSAITCDIVNFETLYNQPDFLSKLKEICKKFCMPYGKVSKEVEDKVSAEMEIEFSDYFRDLPKREQYEKPAERIIDIGARLREIGYTIENKVSNLDELYSILKQRQEESKIKNGKETGIAKLRWSKELIELYIDFIERDYSYQKMAEVLGKEKPTTAQRYVSELLASGIIKSPIGRGNSYIANEDIVKFVNGRKRISFTADWDWLE